MNPIAPSETGTHPFPGLRPFEPEEARLFFGREGQSAELLRRLRESRFLAVLGTSGSGKSSLVLAGLLPFLKRGVMRGVGSSWRVARFRPGADPIGNLAVALSAPGVLRDDVTNALLEAELTEGALRLGALGLVDRIAEAELPAEQSVLIVVDQFEELFRMPRAGTREPFNEDAAAFVQLLLEAARQRVAPLYVLLTMRSEYLGDCAQFRDLPETINSGQYLIPRMTRDERRRVITGPVAVGRGDITPRLVNRLLNDVGDDPDQLPILQHALMRTWDYWMEHRTGNEPLDMPHYDAIGGMGEALTRHADEAFEELGTDRAKRLAEKVFRRITEKGLDNREVRRPTMLQELCAITEASSPEVTAVIDVLRRRGRSFLTPRESVPLGPESLIDISHESLIRGWARLKRWVDLEADSARQYRQLAEAAAQGRELWRGADLTLALRWWKTDEPNEAWARVYHPGFAAAKQFLRRSQRQRTRMRTAVAAALVGLVGVTLGMWRLAVRAARAERQSDARALAAAALENLGTHPELSLPLAIQAAERTYLRHEPVGPEANLALHQALHAVRMRLLLSARGPVHGVTFDSAGLRVAAGGGDTVRVWDALSGELLLAKPWPEAFGVAFSPDGKWLAAAGVGGVRTWDSYSGDARRTLAEHQGAVTAVAFSPDGALIATGSAVGTWVWNAATAGPGVACRGEPDPVWNVAFSPDGKRVAIATEGRGGDLRVCDARTGALLATQPDAYQVSGVAWVPPIRSPGVFIVAGHGMHATFWDASHPHGGSPLSEGASLSDHRDNVWGVAVSPDGRQVATASADGTAKLWDVETDRDLTTLLGHRATVSAVSFSSSGTVLATASLDSTVRLWDLSDLSAGELPTLKERAEIWGLSIAASGGLILTGSDLGARLWNAKTGEGRPVLRPFLDVSAVAFAPRGPRFAVAGHSVAYLYRDSLDASPMPLRGHSDFIWGIAFSPDGSLLATASDDSTVILWDAETGQGRDTLRLHFGVRTVAFSPDGKRLVTGDRGGTARIWDVATGDSIARLPHKSVVDGVAFSPDGRYVATASWDWTAVIWETKRWQGVDTLRGHVGPVRDVAFSPDSKRLATVGSDGTTREWDVETGRPIVTLRRDRGWAYKAAYTPDGSQLLSAGVQDSAVRRYMTQVSDLLNEARLRVTRPLEREECKRFLRGRSDCPSRTVELIAEGQHLALRRQVDSALAAFTQAAHMDPSIELHGLEARARRLAATSFATTGDRYVHLGQVSQARRDYEEAERVDSTYHISPIALNGLCWYGSLADSAVTVMPACERAVAADTTVGFIRDSRGVARVLTGDTRGAIQDFQAFVRYSRSEEQRAERLRWIAALRTHRPPWTAAEFRALRNQ